MSIGIPTNLELAAHLFLQLAVILVCCKVVGYLFRYLGQAQVVSEMVTGVLLGPSLFGLLAPDVQHFLFPKTLTLMVGTEAATIPHPSMTVLYALSQLGLVFYMFLVGLEFNTKLISKHFKHASIVSLSGVIIPLLFGGALGLAFSDNQNLFTGNIKSWQAALFLGSAMCITAFPMLARIIYENGITKTKIGTLAIGAAAFDDAIAWSLLAIVLATTKNSPAIAMLAIGGGFGYALVMILGGRHAFKFFDRLSTKDGEVKTATLVILLTLLMVCAWFTDMVGIHSIFGAFIAGAVMPRGRFAEGTRQAMERITVAILIPVFFVYTGLNTQLNLLIQPSLFWIAIVIIAVAFACKGGGCMLATRMGGTSWREATIIGVLMNARGMMELILINIGLENGLITPALFTMLVVMAILTTFVTSPLFKVLYGRETMPLLHDAVHAKPSPK